MSTGTPEATFDVIASRSINASPQAVFRAWTDPEWFRRWFETTQLVIHPEKNDLYFIEVQWEGRLWAHYGRYLQIDAPRLLKFTWMSEATQGKDTVVTVELSSRDGKRTDLRLTHVGLPDNQLGRGHEEGWKQGLANLAKSVE
jgi:uncharacterized protein YndB with AHSA1/START domain